MNNGLSFIPIGIAICYSYLTLRESNKTNKTWYELDPLESVAILYCIFIASIRANWVLFLATLKIGIIVILVALVWYILYNIEEFKNMILLIMRKNSIVGENNYETDFENALIENCVSEKENCTEKVILIDEIINAKAENEVEEAISEIDENLDKWIPQIDKFIENFNADTKIYIEYVEQKKETDTTETSSDVDQFSSEELVSELERITDNLVRDTRKIADNVCMVSSMLVENLTTESIKDMKYKNSKTTINAENTELDSGKVIPETKIEQDMVSVLLDTNNSSDHPEWEIEDEEQLICHTENIAESMVTAITSFVETLTQ